MPNADIDPASVKSVFLEIQVPVFFNLNTGMFGLRSKLYTRSFELTPSSFCILFLSCFPNICYHLPLMWNHGSVAFNPSDYTNSIYLNSKTEQHLARLDAVRSLSKNCWSWYVVPQNSGAAQDWALKLQDPEACVSPMLIMPSFSYLMCITFSFS